VDADTKLIIDANPAALFMVGVSRDEVVGQPCKNYLCSDRCDGCPVMTANLSDGVEEVENTEIVLYRRDGSLVYALLTINSIILNNKRLFINSLINITKQKQAEALLKEHWNHAEMEWSKWEKMVIAFLRLFSYLLTILMNLRKVQLKN
jgi:PAS domain S-box-containing protein